MSVVAGQQNPLTAKLVDLGLIPPYCTDIKLHIAVGDVVRVQCEVLVTEEQMRRITDAVCAEDVDALQVEYSLISPRGMRVYKDHYGRVCLDTIRRPAAFDVQGPLGECDCNRGQARRCARNIAGLSCDIPLATDTVKR